MAAGATGHGVDQDADAIAHGRKLAVERGLADRVTLDVGDAGLWSGEADVLIVNGASQVWGGDPLTHTANALAAGGRLLAHPDDTEVRERADRQREWRLKGWRGVLGMAYLTLVVPA